MLFEKEINFDVKLYHDRNYTKIRNLQNLIENKFIVKIFYLSRVYIYFFFLVLQFNYLYCFSLRFSILEKVRKYNYIKDIVENTDTLLLM